MGGYGRPLPLNPLFYHTTPVRLILARGNRISYQFLGRAVPESQPSDALHIALAAVHGVQYLVSWNFRHIVNAALRPAIEQVCRDHGYDPPILCTPEELLEVGND